MIFLEKKGKKLNEAKDFCETLQLDISNLDKYFHVKKYTDLKDEKVYNFGNKKVELNYNKYLIYSLYNDYSNYIKHEFHNYLNKDVTFDGKAKQYNIPKYIEFLRKELNILLGSYIMYSEYDYDEVFEFMKTTYEYILESVQKTNSIEKSAIDKLNGAVATLESDYQSATNKAIGNEMGWLYGTKSYSGAAAGTFLTTATLESDQNNAQSRFSSSLASITFNREMEYDFLLKNTYEMVLSNFMKFIFQNDFTKEELNDIDNYLSNNNIEKLPNVKDIFYSYPFLKLSYYSIINALSEDDYNYLIEIIDYFDNRASFEVMLNTRVDNEFIDKLNSKTISRDYLFSDNFRFYCILKEKKADTYFETYLYDLFKKIITNKHIYFKYITNLEFACEVMGRLNNAKAFISSESYDDLVSLLKRTNKADKTKKIDLNDFDYILGGIAGVVLFIVLIIKMIMFGETPTIGLAFKYLIFAFIGGGLVSFLNTFADIFILSMCNNAYTNSSLISWFNIAGAKKRHKTIAFTTCSLFILIVLLIIPLTSADYSDRLNIYSANSWKSDSYSGYSLRFDRDGTLNVLDRSNNNLKKYNCDINFNSKNYDKDKTWYDTHGGMTCDIDGEKVDFSLRTCIYKESMEDTHLYIQCVGDFKECPSWAKEKWDSNLSYDRSNSTFN